MYESLHYGDRSLETNVGCLGESIPVSESLSPGQLHALLRSMRDALFDTEIFFVNYCTLIVHTSVLLSTEQRFWASMSLPCSTLPRIFCDKSTSRERGGGRLLKGLASEPVLAFFWVRMES